jgi:hypothetical protein
MRRAAAGRAPARGVILLLGLLVSIAAVGCGALGGASPNPGCPNGDVRAAGTFPALEALLPAAIVMRAPDSIDSGYNCTAASLGTYTSHGLAKLRFAGATWDQGNGNGTVIAIMAAESDPLDTTWVEEFYTAGAVAGRHTGQVRTDRPTMPGAGQVFRLETVNDLSLQTIVIWPAGPYVHVVIAATTVAPDASRADHDQRVSIAVEVAAAVPVPTAAPG